MDLPEPGGPTMSSEWEPAAAISNTRLAWAWPRTSARSAIGRAMGGATAGFGGGQAFPVGQVGADGKQGAGGQNVRRAGQCRFAGALFGQDEGLAAIPGLQGHGQRAANRPQLAGQRQFAGEFVIGQGRRRDLPAGGEDAEGDRQVEAPGLLGQVGRRQVDGDALAGKLEAGIDDGGAHAVTRLLDLGIGQADQRKAGQAAGQMGLDDDRRRVQAIQSATVGDGQRHAAGLLARAGFFQRVDAGFQGLQLFAGARQHLGLNVEFLAGDQVELAEKAAQHGLGIFFDVAWPACWPAGRSSWRRSLQAFWGRAWGFLRSGAVYHRGIRPGFRSSLLGLGA